MTTDPIRAAGLPTITIAQDECWQMANGSRYGTATSAAVLNADDVHRDPRQHVAAVVGGVTAGSAAGALYLTEFGLWPYVAWALAGASAASALALLALIVLIAREGRRWVYAVTDEPAA